MNDSTKKLTIAAMFSALAFALAALFNVIPVTIVPALPFLHYDPKDTLITLCGFILGPIYGVLVSLVTAVIELSVSNTGLIGAIMNFLSSAIYACVATIIYKRIRNVYGAVLGLFASVISTTAFMLLWNWLITPLYMSISRDAVTAMLLPAFLPFNLVKGAINAGLTLLIYKPMITVLRKTGLVKKSYGRINAANTMIALGIGIGLVVISIVAIYFIKQV